MMARVHPIISTARAVSRLQIVLESVFSPFGIATLPIVSSRRDEQGLLVTIAGLAFALNLSSLLAGMALLAADREHPPPACAARCALSSSDAFRTYARAMTVGAAGTAIALVSAVVCANRRACHAAGRHHAQDPAHEPRRHPTRPASHATAAVHRADEAVCGGAL